MILGLRDQWNIMALGYNASRELFACASPKTERKRRSQTIPRSSPKRSCGLESETPPPGRPPEVAAGDPARPICSCGQGRAAVAGLCIACYRRWQYSARFFGGNRDSALDRDGRACRGCHARDYLNVHHRRPGDRTQLVTLCAGCHARVHRSRILGAGCRRSWSCFGANGIPMRSSSCSFPSNCRPPHRRERAGKHSRVFLREPPPANSRRTSQTGAANILGFSCANRRRPTPGGRVKRGRQIFSGFVPRSGAVPLRVGHLGRRVRGGACRITPLPSRLRLAVQIGVLSPPSPSMPSAPRTPTARTKRP